MRPPRPRPGEGHHGGLVTCRGARFHGGHVHIVIGHVPGLDAVVIVVTTAHVVVVAADHLKVSAHPAPPPPVHLVTRMVTRARA